MPPRHQLTHIRTDKGGAHALRKLDQRFAPDRVLRCRAQGHRRGGDRQVRPAALRTGLVILTCAISAGIHGALIRDPFREGTGAGLGFAVATVLLAVLAVVLTRKPTQLWLV